MFDKENQPHNFFKNTMDIRSPLKNFSFNTFNFIFSSRKKQQSNKKCLLPIPIISSKKIEKPKIEDKFKFEFTNNDLHDIFEEIKKDENVNNVSISPALLTKKRKRNFITINSLNKKNNFIKYSVKNQGDTKLTTFEKEPKNKISVLTYNILNPSCMKKEIQEELSTDERIKKIKREILSLSPDIFCLQEADIYIYKEYFIKNDMNKYEILYGINCGSSFVNIIGYIKEKYILKSFKNFSLANLGKYAGNRGIMNINLELIDNNNNNNNNNNNINKKNTLKKIISVYNVHFPWKYENDRILLLNMIFKHIKESINEEEDKKILIMGDFNSEPSSKLIKLFYYKIFLKEEAKNNSNIINEKEKKTKIDLNTLYLCDEIYNKFHFNSAYQCYSKEKIINGEYMRHPSFTNRTKYFKKTIDYIFFSNNLKLRKILKLPRDYEVDKEKFLPSKDFPSDHIKLFAQFEI